MQETQAIIDRKFYVQFPGGLQKFLLDFDDAYARMDEALDIQSITSGKPSHKIPDATCLEQLFNRIRHIPELWPTITSFEQSYHNDSIML